MLHNGSYVGVNQPYLFEPETEDFCISTATNKHVSAILWNVTNDLLLLASCSLAMFLLSEPLTGKPRHRTLNDLSSATLKLVRIGSLSLFG